MSSPSTKRPREDDPAGEEKNKEDKELTADKESVPATSTSSTSSPPVMLSEEDGMTPPVVQQTALQTVFMRAGMHPSPGAPPGADPESPNRRPNSPPATTSTFLPVILGGTKPKEVAGFLRNRALAKALQLDRNFQLINCMAENIVLAFPSTIFATCNSRVYMDFGSEGCEPSSACQEKAG